jgi:hypothetical protein
MRVVLAPVFPTLTLLVALSPAVAQDAASPGAADGAAIRDVIQHQMEAFRHDDGPAAFAFASPGIQAQFGGDAGSFMAMVRRAYQPVYRPSDTAFGRLGLEQGQVVQHVLVTGPGGARTEALYFMEHEPDGTWRIAGCMLTENPTVGT